MCPNLKYLVLHSTIERIASTRYSPTGWISMKVLKITLWFLSCTWTRSQRDSNTQSKYVTPKWDANWQQYNNESMTQASYSNILLGDYVLNTYMYVYIMTHFSRIFTTLLCWLYYNVTQRSGRTSFISCMSDISHLQSVCKHRVVVGCQAGTG